MDSGPGSGPPWPGFWFRVRTGIRVYGYGSGCLPECTDFLDYLRTFTDFYGLFRTRLVPEKICSGVRFEGGELLLKSGLKQEKLSVRPRYFFKTALKFFTWVEGGIGGPNSPYDALGSPGKSSQNLFYKINFNPRVCFLGLLFYTVVRAVVHKTDFRRG